MFSIHNSAECSSSMPTIKHEQRESSSQASATKNQTPTVQVHVVNSSDQVHQYTTCCLCTPSLTATRGMRPRGPAERRHCYKNTNAQHPEMPCAIPNLKKFGRQTSSVQHMSSIPNEQARQRTTCHLCTPLSMSNKRCDLVGQWDGDALCDPHTGMWYGKSNAFKWPGNRSGTSRRTHHNYC